MTEQRIEPHKVTKPIQLLAAWLVGLCILTGSFLGSAVALGEQSWLCAVLVFAAILDVPLFLYALFLLQTKYRPEMQEDGYYATYLDKNTNRKVEVVKPSLRDPRLNDLLRDIADLRNQVIHASPMPGPLPDEAGLTAEQDWKDCRIAVNDYHPDFPAMRKALKMASIPVVDFFGSPNSELPKKWILSVDPDCDTSLLHRALAELLKFTFDGIALSQRIPEIDQNEHIYVGSYAWEEGYAPITEELRDLVKDGFELVDLAYYIRKHKVT